MRNPPYTIFNMKTNILQEFSIWIGVPLNHISKLNGSTNLSRSRCTKMPLFWRCQRLRRRKQDFLKHLYKNVF